MKQINYYKVYFFFILTQIICYRDYAQSETFIPREKQELNYRLVPFNVPPSPGAVNYILQVAKGSQTTDASFKKNIIINSNSDQPGQLIELPDFGSEYTWRSQVTNAKGQLINKSKLQHFTVLFSAWVDTSKFRVRVTKEFDTSLLFALDYSRCIFSFDGKPVWFLKNIPDVVKDSTLIRDLKQTPQGTFTFLTDNAGFEIDYDCNILWRTPLKSSFTKDSTNNYHHDFTKLSNGHFMVLGDEYVYRRVPDALDTSLIMHSKSAKKQNGHYYVQLRLGNILEFDMAGNLTWYWRSTDYFEDTFLFSFDFKVKAMNISPHINAFYFDEEKKMVYASFRDISTIIKIDYDSRKVKNNYYGFLQDGNNLKQAIFNGQHSCRINSEGQLYFFNNNGFGEANKPASILIAQERNDSLIKVKEITNPFATGIKNYSMRGGNVVELTKGAYLCNMGSINQSFLADSTGIIKWNAFTEKQTPGNLWIPFTEYRISPIDPHFFLIKTNLQNETTYKIHRKN